MAISDGEARAIVAEEASSTGAHLLWWGRPAPRRFALQALPASVFGIPFTGFALFWMWSAAGGFSGGAARGPGLLFPLFGLPFVAVGVGLLLSPLFALASARRTLYAVTTTGILIVKAGRSRRVERHPLPGDEVLAHSRRADGSGDLVVGSSSVTDARGRATHRTVTFVGIPDVAKVERIVADAARGRTTTAPPPAQGGSPTASGRVPFPAHRAEPGRVVPPLLALAVGVAIGFGIAVLLAREGKLLPAAPGRAPAPSASAASAPIPPRSPPSRELAPPQEAAPDVATGDPACDAGDAAACARAARVAYERMGTTDRARGAALAARGCDLGSAGACAYLAWILDGNGGIELSDPPAAMRAAERGCRMGSDEACRIARRHLEK